MGLVPKVKRRWYLKKTIHVIKLGIVFLKSRGTRHLTKIQFADYRFQAELIHKRFAITIIVEDIWVNLLKATKFTQKPSILFTLQTWHIVHKTRVLNLTITSTARSCIWWSNKAFQRVFIRSTVKAVNKIIGKFLLWKCVYYSSTGVSFLKSTSHSSAIYF